MADFLTNLWESVFTPGATPTLLLATNIAFAFLQLTLAALLAATYSIHFVILSVLCGGLWWSINWFANEVRQAQEKEEEAKRIRKLQEREKASRDGESADDEQGDTETEAEPLKNFTPHSNSEADDPVRVNAAPTWLSQTVAPEDMILGEIQDQQRPDQASQTSALHVPDESTRHRRTTSDMSASGDFSTDSEWEKVDN